MHLKSEFAIGRQISGDYLEAVLNAARISTAALDYDGERLDGRLPDGPAIARTGHEHKAGL
jgi:hypothetical protein